MLLYCHAYKKALYKFVNSFLSRIITDWQLQLARFVPQAEPPPLYEQLNHFGAQINKTKAFAIFVINNAEYNLGESYARAALTHPKKDVAFWQQTNAGLFVSERSH